MKNHLFYVKVCMFFSLQSGMRYGDLFHDTWKVFSKYDYIHLNTFQGSRVSNQHMPVEICVYIYMIYIDRLVLACHKMLRIRFTNFL